MKNITINTDAGFYPDVKVGSYAYWIVSDGLLIRGSGIFRDLCKNSTDAETKAMCNAVHVLLNSDFDFCGVQRIFFNRDNLNAKSGRNGTAPQKKLTKLLRKVKHKCLNSTPPIVEFRHVKAHSNKDDPRSYVNKWCDKQCTLQLKEWRLKNKQLE